MMLSYPPQGPSRDSAVAGGWEDTFLINHHLPAAKTGRLCVATNGEVAGGAERRESTLLPLQLIAKIENRNTWHV